MSVAEIAFLVSLTSADNAVSTTAAKALREIALAEGSPTARKKNALSEERSRRFTIYEQLGDPTVVTIGEWRLNSKITPRVC
jgi:neurofibromin 1